MAKGNEPIEIYLEIGQKKTFASALAWPGWCRGGRDEAAALLALVDYGPRYAQVLKGTGLGFRVPDESSELVVVEKVKGNATTDFGAPDRPLPGDDEPVDPDELRRWETILKACWKAFDEAVEAAAGATLVKGPRGGGRSLAKMVGHVLESDQSYLSALGGKYKQGKGDSPDEVAAGLRRAVLETLAGRVSGEVPAQGPRGGARWAPRYFIRRLAWHCLDHAWEIEDRVE